MVLADVCWGRELEDDAPACVHVLYSCAISQFSATTDRPVRQAGKGERAAIYQHCIALSAGVLD